MGYYPYDDVIKEASRLRQYFTIHAYSIGLFFTDTEALEYVPLFPKWEGEQRRPWRNAIVRHNDKIYRVYNATFPSTVTLEPQEDPEHYYEINDTAWTEYVSGTAYSSGARVKVSSSETTINYYISKTDNNTATPTNSSYWYRIGPYMELFYIGIILE